MKATPMIFNGEMVQAILREIAAPVTGKWQTRRLVVPKSSAERIPGDPNNPQVLASEHLESLEIQGFEAMHHVGNEFFVFPPCPYGDAGDLIYVRESGWQRPLRSRSMMRNGADTWPAFEYDADKCDHDQLKEWDWIRRPSIHMPRWASRITLEITSRRADLLQEISEDDAIAEGINGVLCSKFTTRSPAVGELLPAAVLAFAGLWDSIYSNWHDNPWVWVIEFKPHLVNVDAFIKQMEAA